MKTKRTTFNEFIERVRQLPQSAAVVSLEIKYIDEFGNHQTENKQQYTIAQLFENIKFLSEDTVIISFELKYSGQLGYESKIEFK